ncbi:30S ribosomal protein S17 [Candidatus Annandia adelgestsuga]|uniref:Small ribosomal subunit protein uS17 n=1 Tax=Candidatus Annandia adelgestsuga TaxID=1302411 RepID=A0A3S9J7D6_9ENTR|nr:30S ribosomal protein S17 [Candidatus Annandia adelgestsuga]AZP36213.1 30S ribosomal protein S17 [Candidatus Annandia adelgestsuga]
MLKKKNNIFYGSVIKKKMEKSATVVIKKKIKHLLYGKFITRIIKIHIHDENNKCKVGDWVKIKLCKPISKTKSWNLIKILNKNKN